MSEVLAFRTRQRAVVCEGCARVFTTSELPPYLCQSCVAAADAALEAEIARAAGFASFEEYIEAEYRRSMGEGESA